MRAITVTQTYELIVTAEVDVPDDCTYDDMVNAFTDFPIRVDVNPVWDDTENGMTIGGLCVDALVSLTGDDTLVLYEMKDDEWTRIEESEESDDES